MGVMRSDVKVTSGLAFAREGERARGLARKRAAEHHRLPGLPREALAGTARNAGQDDAVVAVDDAGGTGVVERVDGDVLARDAGVTSVDGHGLVARAADGERQGFGGKRVHALAAR